MIYSDYQYNVQPSRVVRVLIDSDTRNEADDQFAIVQALLSPRLDNVGIIAAHFGTSKCEDSMQRSYDEVLRLLDAMGLDYSMVIKGAPAAMPAPGKPVASAGSRRIIEEAMKQDERPLYVLFMGLLTDLASAYLEEPRIAGRLTCIWIGGGTYPVGEPEFNLYNDIHAANVVFNSDIPLWQVPRNVYQKMLVSMAELEHRVRPCGRVGRYLFDQMVEWSNNPLSQRTMRTGEFWFLGDSPAVGLLLCDEPNSYEWRPAPRFAADMQYIHSGNNRPIRVYHDIDCRFIMEDLYAKLALYAQRRGE